MTKEPKELVEWNKLPVDMRNANSLDGFRVRCLEYLKG